MKPVKECQQTWDERQRAYNDGFAFKHNVYSRSDLIDAYQSGRAAALNAADANLTRAINTPAGNAEWERMQKEGIRLLRAENKRLGLHKDNNYLPPNSVGQAFLNQQKAKRRVQDITRQKDPLGLFQ